ncbi:MAG TPA: hypothetical protein VLB68_16845 [Pyrinomonadaceae bacterium]|nr:hypothetical protein [Pyrinomonadaceae bacterium]
MLPKTQKVVSPKQFDKLFREEALIALFSSEKEEEAYERRDALLIRLIRREIKQHFGRNKARHPFVVDDWWPDHTRFIEATPAHCTAAFLTALRRLLKDKHKDFRIQICVYKDPMEGTTYIGSMALYSNRVLIEKRLHKLLESSGA